MKKKRRRFSAEFKLKVILEALRERHSLSELGQKYDLHPNQISKWKSEFLENAKEHMNPCDQGIRESEKQIEKLYAKIGKLQMENEYLKKRFS